MKKGRKILSVIFSLSLLSQPYSIYGTSGPNAQEETLPETGEVRPMIEALSQSADPDAVLSADSEAASQPQESVRKKASSYRYADGSRGFFAYRNQSEALQILNEKAAYTEMGAEHDATSLKNMLKSLDILEDANTIRRFLGKSEYRITDALMAHSQIRANWSYDQYHENENYDHAPLDWVSKPAGWISWAENLDNFGSPDLDMLQRGNLAMPRNSFDGWYYYEKERYESTAGASLDDPTYGHYANLIQNYAYAGAAYIPFEDYRGQEYGTELQNFMNYRSAPAQSYTVAQYRRLLEDYIRQLPDAPLFVNAVLSNVPDCTYTGEAQTPAATVTLVDAVLIEGQDYTLQYQNNVNAGTATIIATGCGKYSGTVRTTFEIAPRSIESGSVSGMPGMVRSLAELEAADLQVECDGHQLVKGVDFTVECEELPLGDNYHTPYQAMIRGIGNYCGEKQELVFGPMRIDVLADTYPIADVTYTGEPLTPPVTLSYGRILQEGEDYTLRYVNNCNAGEASVVIEGIGSYGGTITQTFQIRPESIGNAVVSSLPESVNSLSELQNVQPYVQNGFTPLIENQDYTVAREQVTSAQGTDYFRLTISGKGNYKGKLVRTWGGPKTLENAWMSSLDDLIYTGKALRPRPNLWFNETLLVEGQDYRLHYTNNVNAGEATITAIGMGDYSGALSQTFRISIRSISNGVQIEGIPDYADLDQQIDEDDPILVCDGVEIPRSDYTVDLSRVEWEGQAYVWRFTFTGVNNCTGILHNAVYRKEDLSRLSLSIDDQTFTGQEIRPEISAILDGVPLSENWNYTLRFLHNVHAGTATVILTGIGAYAGEKRVDFQILPDTVRNLDIEVDHVREIQNAQQLEDNMRVLIRETRQPADPADYIAEVVSVNLDTHRAVIRLTGKRDYTGSREFIFDIGGPREDEIRPEDSTAMYRLYNPNTGEHFYTADSRERNYLSSIGWNDEGLAWIAPVQSHTPVYRLYNPNAGDHHYTPDPQEYIFLQNAGWQSEGIGWYSDDARGQALLRLYNPNTTGAGAHHYTTDAHERDYLQNIGWKDEGVGWYGKAQ